MRIFRSIAALAIAGLTLCSCGGGGSGSSSTVPVDPSRLTQQQFLQKINHIVFIYQENWSFDGLYGSFPGANGVASASATSIQQIDKLTGAPLSSLPQPLVNGQPDSRFPATMPVAPVNILQYVSPSAITGDIVHRFYQEQSQIDGGKMDKFATWSDNPGLVLTNFDASNLPEGQLAKQYVMMDNFFHSAFGGSFLNHQFLICTCAPTFPNAPSSVVATVDSSGKQLALDSTGKIVHDGFVTPDGLDVNTSFTVNTPHPGVPSNQLVPNQSAPTIGDRMSAANVSWKWYSGGWNNALAGNPDPLFQFHHQPFAYYSNFADGTGAKAAHLQDEANFFTDVQNGSLPSVSFIKPLGPDNEHPGYASLIQGQNHVATLVNTIKNSPYWKDTVIVVSYDEHGGRWDHVAPPPPPDRFGPGSRVPGILISAYAKHGYVDHTQYETVSILSMIELRFGLQPLSARDAAANPMLNAFDFTQPAP